ncbi:MAG TPA: LysE family transporter [Lachnospiraceae bacterium]|nr:LysE family transporter [Lachnospiraceae bacterium]
MFIKGLKFGMLLQFSVGPVCLFVFNIAGENGFLGGLTAMAAAILKNEKIQKIIKVFGFIILLIFGLNTIFGAFGRSLFSGPDLFSSIKTGNLFLQGILLTASNPLTILFWSGVFSTQAVAYQMNKPQLFYYGLGCVFATILFLTAVSGAGCLAHSFLSEKLMMCLHIIVGSLLIVFGLKLLTKKI